MVPSSGPFLLEVRLDPSRIRDSGEFPFTIPTIRCFDRLVFDPKVTFLVGENGTGKSTLVEAIATLAGFNPEGGDKNLRFSTRPVESPLANALQLVRGPRRERDGFFLRAESFFNVASALDDAGAIRYGDRSLHTVSHGEAFLALFEHRFDSNSLYVFDEPDAALSPQRQLSLLAHVHRLAEAEGCQFVIATHSPILLGYPGGTIYELEDEAIRRVTYQETATFRVMRAFLMNRDGVLRKLLEPDKE